MAITISNLTNKKGNNSYTFSDLHMDLEETKSSANNRNSNVVNGSDILADVDEQVIRNQIRNLFTQTRYLNPLFDINIRKYIGQPLSEMGARSLGQAVDKGISLFIPTVRVTKILVAPNYDNFSYEMALFLDLPNFGSSAILKGNLNSNGSFDFVN